MTIKVYELAKEYGVQSKDFVPLLQQADVNIKNHMSNLTDQQEKYFRNNFAVLEGKLVKRSAEEVKQATQSQKPQTKIIKPVEKAHQQSPTQQPEWKTSQPQQRETASSSNQGQRREGGSGYQGQRREGTNPNYQGGQRREGNSGVGYQGQRREGGSGYQGQRREGTKPNYQGGQRREGNSGGGYQGQRREGGSGYQGQRREGTKPNYQGGQRREGNSGGGYQGQRREGGSGYQGQRPYSSSQRPAPYGNRAQGANGQRGGAPRSTGDEKPLEKPKTDKYKNNLKQKNDAKNKAKENFFKEEKPYGRLDNSKRKRGSKSQYKTEKQEKKEKRATSGVVGTVTVADNITVSELSEKILISPTDIIKTLMSYGIMASINQSLDFDTVSIICEELGITVEMEKEEDLFEKLQNEHFEDEQKLKKRPPIVTVMGHVDHGKTSLLDAIKNTDVISGEAGGITQHIGAYTITMRDKPITFIDTPGHKAFTAMRSRGASVTDIAVLVVAADDGVMPQTIEAINHAKAAKVPIVVAINKIDKPTANPDKVKQELTEYGVVSEDWGGDVICANVSAKSGEGIDNLLDMILLVADVEDLKANFEKTAIGTVIESRIDKQRGITATLLVKSGTLHDGDYIVVGTIYGKVRVMTNHKGQKVDVAGPSMAVEVLGLSEVPAAGDKFFVAENEREAKKITDKRKAHIRILANRAAAPKTLEDIFNQVHEGELKEISLIVKTDVAGSFEAIKQELEKLNENDDGIKISVIHGGVGDVSETDTALASASSALIIAFNVKTDNNARAFADKEGVEIRSYTVIYDIIDDIEAAMKGLKEPEYEEVVTGEGEVRAVFKVPDIGLVAGSYITNGAVKRSDKIRVKRGGKVIHEGTISSLKRFKEDAKEVNAGYECGIGIEKYNDITENDTLEFYSMREIKE